MEEHKEPRVAPGQELTVHPGDPVRGAEMLEERQPKGPDETRRTGKEQTPEDPDEPDTFDPDRFDADDYQMEIAEEPAPDLRRGPEGGPAFAATLEPEYETTGPDGRSAEPQRKFGPEHQPSQGATAQDDIPMAFGAYPNQRAEGDLTFVAVFEDITGAKSCADDLERRRLAVEVAMVARRGDGPEQGTRPGNVVTGPEYGASAEDESPPKEPGMGSGVAVGATIGATAGLLAATYFIPQFGATLVAAPSLLTTLAGAGIGSFLGGLAEYGTSEQQDGDDASIYPGLARRGGVMLLVRAESEDADKVRHVLELWRPLEIRVQ